MRSSNRRSATSSADVHVYRLERSQVVAAELSEVFEFFSAARNLERLTPSWLRFAVLTPEPIELREGTLIDYRLRLHGLPMRWRTRIESWEPPNAFEDRQLRGPYALWHHRHEFAPVPGGTLMRDIVHYRLPLGRVGRLVHALIVARDLRRIFDYRHNAVTALLAPAPGRRANAIRDQNVVNKNASVRAKTRC